MAYIKMRNKTIAIVINTSWNVYNFRMGILKSLKKEGYKVIVIAPLDEYSKKLEHLGFIYQNITINNKGTNPFEDIKLIVNFYQLFKEINPDVLLHYTIKPNIYGSLAARLAGIPVINNISGLGTVFLNNNLSSKIAKLLYKVALQGAHKVFFQNPDDQSVFLYSKLIEEDKTGLLPGSGIDSDKFSPPAERREAERRNKFNEAFSIERRQKNSINRRKTKKYFSFLFIARLVKDKGLLEYVDAARLLKTNYPNVHFNILGAFYPGNPSAIKPVEIEQWQKDNIIVYLGEKDDVASVIAYYSDCVVLPSYREGLSRVLLEAASMTKPIITTNVPGCKDVVDDGVNGFLCKVKSVTDLAKQMDKMLKLNEKERLEMGRKGRAKVIDQFDENIVINHYKNTIQQMLSKNN